MLEAVMMIMGTSLAHRDVYWRGQVVNFTYWLPGTQVEVLTNRKLFNIDNVSDICYSANNMIW